MQIDKEKCIGCEECHPYCPVGAIITIEWGSESVSEIIQDDCVECGVCLRSEVCPTEAIYMPDLKWPRSIRAAFSDPLSTHPSTNEQGRGTEEMKTNEVTGRFEIGEVGFAIDLGRPNGGGLHLREVEKITKAMAGLNVRFETDSPITYFFDDPALGTLRKEILDEFVVSAIVEFKTDLNQCIQVLQELERESQELNTVFSVGLISLVDEDGTIPVKNLLEKGGFKVAPQGKTNIGLGRAK